MSISNNKFDNLIGKSYMQQNIEKGHTSLLYYSTIINYNLWIRKIPDLPKIASFSFHVFLGTYHPQSHQNASLTLRSLKAMQVQGLPTNPQVSAKQSENPIRNLARFSNKKWSLSKVPRSLPRPSPPPRRFFFPGEMFHSNKNPGIEVWMVGLVIFEVNHV